MTRPPHPLTHRLLGADGPDIGCDGCFDQLHRYVELTLGRGAPDLLIPGMRAHLQGCPTCMQEYEGLVALALAELGGAGS